VKILTSFAIACLISTCAGLEMRESSVKTLASIETGSGSSGELTLFNPFDGTNMAGKYLSGRFAQQHHDWRHASTFLRSVIEIDPEDGELIKRAMVLSMGSGDSTGALEAARKVVELEPNSALGLLFLATEAIRHKNYEGADAAIGKVPDSSLSDFIMPLMQSWIDAALGELSIERLDTNSIHIYHAILIAAYLDRNKDIERLLAKSLSTKEITPESLEDIADIYAYIGNKKMALDLYAKTHEAWPENKKISENIEKLESGVPVNAFKKVKSPQEGIARAMLDTARTLYQEYSDDSARVFAHMALYLNPQMTDAKLLLAHISARHERYAQAIEYYKSIEQDNEYYLEARRHAADLLEESNRVEEALLELQNLIDEHNDLEALIQMGDVHRHNEDFKKAIEYYNKAFKGLGKNPPPEYWHLHYMRGMCYERLDEWAKAESDLKAALEFQPDHPLVLNYLGYAWADQGTNLDESLKMIRRAVALRPSDGYITDSLGWVLYRRGEYEAAVPHLEKAVELLPYDPVINDHLGDAYWRVGRRLEARFQWERAKNHAENDEKLISQVNKKLSEGMAPLPVVIEASSQQGKDSKILNP